VAGADLGGHPVQGRVVDPAADDLPEWHARERGSPWGKRFR
jgi:hypothetical protein